tara:strand:- start:4958 stop:5182 length:225 start_codon:yes stop_codon:yes gene_type:complete
MSKKEIHYADGTSEVVDLTAEEETQRTADIAKAEEEKQAVLTAMQTKADLKASAKAKLMSGEALTEDEANTIVI